MREALFATLGDVSDAVVLDLYAGSGALGIEALSRGAERVVFVEQSSACATVLRSNLERLDLVGRSRVLREDALRAVRRLAREGSRFDLVLADPPYEAEAVAPLLRELREAAILALGGTLVVERGRRHAVSGVNGLELLEEREYGDTVLSRFASVADPEARRTDE